MKVLRIGFCSRNLSPAQNSQSNLGREEDQSVVETPLHEKTNTIKKKKSAKGYLSLRPRIHKGATET